MRDIWITHPALIVCYRIVFCAKPVPTFAHDALGFLAAGQRHTELASRGLIRRSAPA
jgi:hypothetical protein